MNKGVIKAKRKGKCFVIAKYKGKKYACNVKVKEDKKITKTPKPEMSSSPISPSASSQSSSVPNKMASSDDIKLVIDVFNQETKDAPEFNHLFYPCLTRIPVTVL